MDDLDDLIWSSVGKADKSKSNTGQASLASLAKQPLTSSSLSRSASLSGLNGNSSFLKPQPASSTTAFKPSSIPSASSISRTSSPFRSNTPQTISRSTTPNPASNDAFSTLVSFNSSKNDSNLSLSERARLKEQEALQKKAEAEAQYSSSDSFWDALGGGSTLQPQRSTTPSIVPTVAPRSSTPVLTGAASASSNKKVETWDVSTFESNGATQKSEPLTDDPFDLGSLQQRSYTPQIQTEDDDGDDFLGDLAKPVDQVRKPSPAPVAVAEESLTRPPRPEQTSIRRDSSREPPRRSATTHDGRVAQIVDMGFSATQARVALAACENNVEEAVNLLLQTGSKPQSGPARSQSRELEEHASSDEELQPKANGGGRWAEQRQDRPSRPDRKQGADGSSSRDESTRQLQEQAEKVLNQGREVGLNMLKSAGEFWKMGKKSIGKAIDEFSLQEPPSSGPRKPKWMMDDVQDERTSPKTAEGGFKDDFDDVEPVTAFAEPPPRTAKGRSPPSAGPSKPSAQTTADLFETAYVSPARRIGRNSPATSAPPSKPASPAPGPKAAPKAPVMAAPPKPFRTLVPASQTQISTSERYKAEGNEKFKLGQYGDAIARYSMAIDSLPQGHLNLTVLHNNRATARLKNGEQRATIEDCGIVIAIIGNDHSSPLPAEYQHIKLREQLVKALNKRAEANEVLEKYGDAKADYEKVVSIDGPSRTVTEGLRRCDRILNPPKVKKVPSRPKPRPALEDLGSEDNSAGVAKMREAAAAQSLEEDQRFQLQETINAKLLAWRGGKERNLRALIASLDTVLWRELQWQTVGLNQLIQNNQVKIRYMKAIAKLHPDKLSSMKLTLEQKLMADGIFSTLNQAWDAFKADNNM